MGLQNAFSVPIFTTFLDPKIVEHMEALITPRLKNLKEINAIYTSDYYEEESIVSPNEIEPFLSNIFNQCVNYGFQHKINIPGPNINYWIQDYKKDQHHNAHSHGRSSLSGVYYIRANENAGEILFKNPNPYVYNIEFIEDGYKSTTEFYIKPKTGLLILFPSYLTHQTIPSKEENVIRTCLAFNII